MSLDLRHFPNVLTASRIMMASVFPIVGHEWWLAVLTFSLATEYLDGALARRFNWESKLGRWLDPIADKIFFVSVALTFVLDGRLTLAEVLLLSIRDLMVILGALWFSIQRSWQTLPDIAPATTGKVTTVVQYLTFFSCLVALSAKSYFVGLTFIFGSFAAIRYFLEMVGILRGGHGIRP